MDTMTRAQRSALMSRIRGKDTRPELVVRSLLHRMGLRFRLHSPKLPGRPDIVLPSRKTVVFVHGCFWHRHARCRFATTPASNKEFWQAKFEANRARDRRNIAALRKLGWRVIVVWECQVGRSLAGLRRIRSARQYSPRRGPGQVPAGIRHGSSCDRG